LYADKMRYVGCILGKYAQIRYTRSSIIVVNHDLENALNAGGLFVRDTYTVINCSLYTHV